MLIICLRRYFDFYVFNFCVFFLFGLEFVWGIDGYLLVFLDFNRKFYVFGYFMILGLKY